MTPYLLFFSIEFLLIFIGLCTRSSSRRDLLIAASVFLLVAFSGLRGMVGADTAAYHAAFLDFEPLHGSAEDWSRFEPLFMVAMAAIKLVTRDPYIFVLSIAVLQGVLLYLILRKWSASYLFLFAYLCYFYLQAHFNILRSGVAALALVLAYRHLEDDRDNWHILLLACLFHYSALLIVPVLLKTKHAGRAFGFGVVIISLLYVYGYSYFNSKFLFYFVDSAFHSKGQIFIGPYFIATALLLLFIHYKVNRECSWRIHLLFVLLVLFKFLQMIYPVMWRQHELIFLVWIAATCSSLSGRLFKVEGVAFTIFCLIGFHFVTLNAVRFDLENRLQREKIIGQVQDSLFDSPLVPYQTFLK